METAVVFDHLRNGFDGKRKKHVLNIMKEIENRAIWIHLMAREQMIDDLRKEK